MPQIKFLNKFVLANILKNFRWLKIRLHDSKLKHLKCPRCYSLSLRYSIYKVQTRSFWSISFAANLFILAHCVESVKYFFQVFSDSFSFRFRSAQFCLKEASTFRLRLVFALPIFPGSHPPSIVGVHELNFCVRNGNRWTLMTINTNSMDGF